MKISIVVPSYNQAQFLDSTLRSLINQDYPDKEIIVMDGGSLDGSVDIILKYESHLASWRSQPDGGQSRAIADGFSIATGEVIGWLNSDDVLSHGALKRVAQAVYDAGTKDGVFYGGYEVIDEGGQVQEVIHGTPTVSWVAKAIGPSISQPGAFWGRDAYLRVGGLDPLLRYGMDKDLLMKFLLSGVRFFLISDVQAQFRSHSNQKGHTVEWLKYCDEEERQICTRYQMATNGSLRGLVARQVQRLLRIFYGKAHASLLFRLIHHHRLRRYTVDYT